MSVQESETERSDANTSMSSSAQAHADQRDSHESYELFMMCQVMLRWFGKQKLGQQPKWVLLWIHGNGMRFMDQNGLEVELPAPDAEQLQLPWV
jgi:hypothetical protein